MVRVGYSPFLGKFTQRRGMTPTLLYSLFKLSKYIKQICLQRPLQCAFQFAMERIEYSILVSDPRTIQYYLTQQENLN